MQNTDTILMVRPAAFAYNEETAQNNFFQQQPRIDPALLQEKVLEQFDNMVSLLKANGINVILIEDDLSPLKPDAVFPNNWFTAGADGGIHLFPMYAPSRRAEKRKDIVDRLQDHYQVNYIKDWSFLESKEQFLEGTGSMVIDHQSRIIYACISDRTNIDALKIFAKEMDYRAIPFVAEDENGRVYHTNVMLSIGDGFCVLCPKTITDHTERIAVAQLLEATGHENIYIEPEHMKKFAGNILQVKNNLGERIIVISQTAVNALPEDKIQKLQNHGRLLPVDVSYIEEVEGGSVRCMMAEIFLEKKHQVVT
jgi:hypothetical protein